MLDISVLSRTKNKLVTRVGEVSKLLVIAFWFHVQLAMC